MLYFAFGSNLNRRQMLTRCPDAVPLERASLLGHRLAFQSPNGSGGIATVVPNKDATVVGALYDISRDDLKALDRYEGWPRLYRRVMLEVVGEKSGNMDAIIYLLNPPCLNADPSPMYRDAIVQGYHDWDLPLDPAVYIRKEQNVG